MKKKGYKKVSIGKFLVMALVLAGGLIYGIKMVQKSQENRSKAATEIGISSNKRSDCTRFWFFDSKNTTECQEKNFCGVYAYQGLRTFKTQDECKKELVKSYPKVAEQLKECTTFWWFDDNNRICQQKNFCGNYMYQSLRTFSREVDCTYALTGSGRQKIRM